MMTAAMISTSMMTMTRRTAAAVEPRITQNLFNRFVAYLDASPRTVETYKRTLRQLFKYFSENVITRPTRDDIVEYRNALQADGKKPATVQLYLTTARLFFKWTAQEGLYPNVAEHVKAPKVSAEHKRDYLTSGQLKDVIGGIDINTIQGKRDFAIIWLMATAGLRTIEISRANVGDLRAIGDQTVLYVQGKGRSEKAEFVKISRTAERAIREYLAARGHVDGKAPLFASLSNNNKGGRLTTRAISAVVKEAMKRTGYDSARLTAHSLRHTAVTLAILAGIPIDEVRDFARHSNIQTTLIYSHALDKAKNRCADAIEAALL